MLTQQRDRIQEQIDTIEAEIRQYDRTKQVANDAYLEYTRLSAQPDFEEYVQKGQALDNGSSFQMGSFGNMFYYNVSLAAGAHLKGN